MPTLCERDLSIIVPVYNLEAYIGPLLRSLKEQETDYTVEIIFVLNNCTDRSEDVIRDSGLECQILNCDIQGCGPARNTALDVARGKYIWFMDGDDWLLTDTAIQEALDAAQGEDIVRIPFDSDCYQYGYFSMVWQYIIRREFIGDIRFPHIQPAEDDAFMDWVLAKAGYGRASYMRLPCVGRPLYYYNFGRPGSNMDRVNKGEKI